MDPARRSSGLTKMLNIQKVSTFRLFDVFRHFGEHLRRCSSKPQKTRRRSTCSHMGTLSIFDTTACCAGDDSTRSGTDALSLG